MMKLKMSVLFFMLVILSVFNVNAEQYHTTISNSRNYFYFIKTDGTLYRFSASSGDIIFEKVMDDVVDVCGDYAVKKDGSMWSWDDTISDIHKITENVKDISSSESHALILKNDNSLWGLGNNSCGQLAQGEIEHNEDSMYFKYKCVPVNFSELVKIMDDVKCAEAGSFYSCVLKLDGSVWTFGCNHFGELGYLTDKEINNKPIQIFENANNIFSGEASGFVTDENNVLYRWGTNYSDSTAGIPSDISGVPVKYFDNVKYLSDMNGFNLIIKEDNTLWIYGGDCESYDIPVKVADNVNYVSSMNEYGDEAIFLDMNGCLYLFKKNENNDEYIVREITHNVQLSGKNDILQGNADKKNIKLFIGGELIKTDVNPIIINDRTMVPVRAVFENIGAEVRYDADKKTVTATKKDKIVELTIDSNIMKINGEETEIDSPATIVEDRTFVPVRACAEAFDLDVEWIEDSRTVKIKKEVSLLSELSYSDGRFSKNTYDENGNAVFVKTSNGEWCKYEYDSMGNILSYEYSNGNTGRYTYDENNNLISIKYSDGSWVEINYDEKGREKTRRNSDGSTEEKIYNENEVTTVYSGGNFEKCVYDNMQNLIYYQDIHGKWEKFGYDENGNMLCYQNDSGYWEKYSYDENGSKLYFENSNGLIEQYSYDDKNKKGLMKNSDGYSEEYTYDKNGNLSYMNCSDGTWYKYKYDEDGNMIYSENDRGNITKKTYDENGNLLVEEYPGVTYKYIVITK